MTILTADSADIYEIGKQSSSDDHLSYCHDRHGLVSRLREAQSHFQSHLQAFHDDFISVGFENLLEFKDLMMKIFLQRNRLQIKLFQSDNSMKVLRRQLRHNLFLLHCQLFLHLIFDVSELYF